MYSIQDLQTFCQIAERGGVTAAAQAQGLSPATVSHRLNKLEGFLGVTLFHRSSRSVALTVEGGAFLERVRGILADLADAEMDIGGHGGKLRGHLRVTMAPWILSRFILPNFHRLQTAEPNLTYDFLAVDRFVNIVEERQDCAIRVGALPDSSFLSAKLADNRRILCAAPAYLDRVGLPEMPDALAAHCCVCLPWQTDWGLGDRMPRIQLTVSNSDTLTDAAAQGLGIVMKSELAVRAELKSGRLVEILPGVLPKAAAPISSIRPAALKTSRKVDAFVRFARGCFEDVS
ncbi:MAG: LysR family transcriptional regulator [Alphaproteobacteria bacterium]|nr:LysR family transcriptional regulator [Alphaproteobacteria bacterium]